MIFIVANIGIDGFMDEFAGSPGLLAYLEANFRGAPESLQHSLLEAAEESGFSLKEWVESLVVMAQWLEVRGLSMSLSGQLGYIRRAAETAGAGASMVHLPSLVREMLEARGCEQAGKK